VGVPAASDVVCLLMLRYVTASSPRTAWCGLCTNTFPPVVAAVRHACVPSYWPTVAWPLLTFSAIAGSTRQINRSWYWQASVEPFSCI
jgi:hypothetical protein